MTRTGEVTRANACGNASPDRERARKRPRPATPTAPRRTTARSTAARRRARRRSAPSASGGRSRPASPPASRIAPRHSTSVSVAPTAPAAIGSARPRPRARDGRRHGRRRRAERARPHPVDAARAPDPAPRRTTRRVRAAAVDGVEQRPGHDGDGGPHDTPSRWRSADEPHHPTARPRGFPRREWVSVNTCPLELGVPS